MTDKKFPLIRVSRTGHSKIQNLETAAMNMANAKGDREATLAAFSLLSRQRKILYEYVEVLERLAGIEQPIVKRFD